jgi:hypothetical protein
VTAGSFPYVVRTGISAAINIANYDDNSAMGRTTQPFEPCRPSCASNPLSRAGALRRSLKKHASELPVPPNSRRTPAVLSASGCAARSTRRPRKSGPTRRRASDMKNRGGRLIAGGVLWSSNVGRCLANFFSRSYGGQIFAGCFNYLFEEGNDERQCRKDQEGR